MSTITIPDQHPSTDDFVPTGDSVLGCLINARERIARGHTTESYATADGEVCAIGALYCEDFTPGDIMDATCMRSACETRSALERGMRQATRDAIAAVDAAALRRYPEAADRGRWSGPLEWVNQELGAFDDNIDDNDLQDIILLIYDDAIATRGDELGVGA